MALLSAMALTLSPSALAVSPRYLQIWLFDVGTAAEVTVVGGMTVHNKYIGEGRSHGEVERNHVIYCHDSAFLVLCCVVGWGLGLEITCSLRSFLSLLYLAF